MKTGPKPLQPAVRLLRGSRRRSGQVAAECETDGPRLATYPPWVSAEVKRLWTRELAQRQLPAWQWTAALEYCTSRVRWEAALQELQRQGDVLVTPAGVAYPHPLVKIIKELAKAVREGHKALGLERPLPVVTPEGQAQRAQQARKQRFFGGV